MCPFPPNGMWCLITVNKRTPRVRPISTELAHCGGELKKNIENKTPIKVDAANKIVFFLET